MVAVAYERLSFPRGSKYSKLTGKTLIGSLEKWTLTGCVPTGRVKNLLYLDGRGGGGSRSGSRILAAANFNLNSLFKI